MSIHARQILLPFHLLWAATILAFCFSSQQFTAVDWAIGVFWWALLSGVGIAIGFHRYFSHHSFVAKPWAAKLMLVAGALAGQGSPIFWVALHVGYHHPHSDKEKDVHSPKHGLWNAYMGWMIHLRPEDVSMKYAVRMLRDPLARRIHDNYNKWFWAAYLAIGVVALAFGGLSAVLAILTALGVSIHQECAVNVMNHTRSAGYQNYATGDCSTNNPITGLLCWGQGWHNNHHKFPGAADFGTRWFELDPTRLIIPLLRAKG